MGSWLCRRRLGSCGLQIDGVEGHMRGSMGIPFFFGIYRSNQWSTVHHEVPMTVGCRGSHDVSAWIKDATRLACSPHPGEDCGLSSRGGSHVGPPRNGLGDRNDRISCEANIELPVRTNQPPGTSVVGTGCSFPQAKG